MATFEERYQEWKKKRAEQIDTSSAERSSFEDRYNAWRAKNRGAEIAKSAQDRLNQWISGHNALLRDYNDRYTGRSGEIGDMAYVSDSGAWLDSFSKRQRQLDSEADSLLASLEKDRYIFGDEWVDSISNMLTEERQKYSGMLDTATKDRDFWSEYESEEDWNNWKTQYAQDQYLQGIDTVQGQKELDELLAVQKVYDDNLHALRQFYLTGDTEDNASLEMLERWFANVEDRYGISADKSMQQLVNEKQTTLTNAKRLQEGIRLSSVNDPESEHYDPEFAQYAGYQPIDGYDVAHEYINGDDSARAKIYREMTATDAETPNDPAIAKWNQDVDFYENMTQEEVDTYNYHYNKSGKAAADAYLSHLRQTHDGKRAEELAASLRGKPALELLYSIPVGLDQFNSGVQGLVRAAIGDESYVAPSRTQMAGSLMREDLEDVDLKWYDFKEGTWNDADIAGRSLGQFAFDGGSTTANMVPSILASTAIGLLNPTAGTVVGSTLIGATAAGNAYQEKINLGYTGEQARAYGLMVGASEAVLQYILGGVSKLGKNMLSSKVLSMLDDVDNILGKVAQSAGGKLFLNGVSEGIEEGLQSILEPYIWQAVSGEEVQVDWQETLYNSLMGFVTGLVFEGGEQIVGNVQQNRQYTNLGKDVLGAGTLSEIQGIANEVGLSKQANKVTSEVAEGKGLGKIGAKIKNSRNVRNVGKLYSNVNQEVSKRNELELANRLTENGFSRDVALVLAETITAAQTGAELSQAQRNLLTSLEGDTRVSDAMDAVFANKKADSAKLNNRMAATNIATEVMSQETKEKAVEDAKEKGFEAAKDGKAIVKKTGKVIDSIKISSVTEDGKVYFETADGTVAAKDISFATESDAVLYATISELGRIIDADTANKLVGDFNANSGISADVYARGVAQAYRYGYFGFDMSEVNASYSWSSRLTEEQRNAAYALGRANRETDTAKLQEERSREKKAAEQTGKKRSQKGGVFFRTDDMELSDFDGYMKKDGRVLNDRQKAAVETMRFLSKAIGANFVVFESYVKDGKRYYTDENGKEKAGAPNGWYDPATGNIYVDLHAGNTARGTMLFTVSHELTHFIAQWSPEKFKELADIVFRHSGLKGTIASRVAAKMARAREKGRPISFEVAQEEVVADAMESVLKSGNVAGFIADVKQQDAALGNKLVQWFKSFVGKLKAWLGAYDAETPDSDEGQAIAEMKELLEELEKIFAEGLMDAGANFRAAEKNTTEDGGANTADDIKLSPREENAFKQFAGKVNSIINQAIAGKGNIDGKVQVVDIMPVGPKLAAMVAESSEEAIEISQRSIALNTGDVWHEYKRHTNVSDEVSRDQVAFTKRQFQNAVKCIVSPDIVETIFTDTNNPTQKQSFAYAKKTARGHYVVVEAVGGKKNPSIYPVMILQFSKSKWEKMMAQGKTLGEILFESDIKKLNALDVAKNKKSRVTAAQFASYEAIANTLHSPQLDDMVSQPAPEVKNESAETTDVPNYILLQERAEESASSRSLLANALESTITNDIERKNLQYYREQITKADELEQKLQELNAQIKELSFAKGKRDMEKIRKLRDEAIKTKNRLTILDNKLLRLEAAAPLQAVLKREKEKVRTKSKERYEAALKDQKANADKKLAEVKEQYRESRAKAVEKRKETAVREKIKGLKKRLETALLRPTDKQYVPIGLVRAMVEVCELIDTDTDLYKKDGSINKAQQQREKTGEKLQALVNEYRALKNHTDPMYRGEFDETLEEYIEALRKSYSGRSLSELSLEELRDMYDLLRGIEETLQDARKLIGWGDNEGVYEASEAIISEQAAIARTRKNSKRSAAQKAMDANLNSSLSPVRNAERMAGYNQDSLLLRLFKKLEQGVRKKNFFVMRAYKHFEALTAQKAYEEAVYEEAGGKRFTDDKGRKFGVSKMQMMQAILSYERETANEMHHIERGGFTFADLGLLGKGKVKDAISAEHSHRVSRATGLISEFVEILKDDPWCQDYMKAARTFFDEMAKDAVNEASLAMKHRIIARDKKYIPFEVDKNFVAQEISAEQRMQQTISAYGMLKEAQKGAAQPLYITGLNNIIERHIEMVGNVYGLGVEVRNFNKVWNAMPGEHTVKEMLEASWGERGVAVLEQAVQDVQGPRVRERSAGMAGLLHMAYDKVKSGYIGATFALNLSVVTKQIGSMFAATSMLKWRGPVRQLANLIRTMANHKSIAAEVDQYTATAWMRRQGLSDAELHTLMTEGKKTWVGKLFSKLPAVINPTKWITAMDHAVALSLWEYAKADVAERTGLEGEALLQAVAEFYDEVVENTQSMTDVLHRPEVQKSDNVLTESFAMFKTDLYQMAGQLHMAAGRYQAKPNKENGNALGRTVYAVAMSAIWGQLMTTLFALLRYRVDRYRDEEDKDLTVESWLKRQGIELLGDLMGYVFPLFGSEAVGVAENIMYGETDEVVDSLALTTINTLYESLIKVASTLKDGEMPEPSAMKKILVNSLQSLGVPANNFLRMLEAISLHAQDIANGEFLSFEAGVERTPKQLLHRIVEAMDEGKSSVAQGLYEDAVEELAIRKADDGDYTEANLKEAKSQLQSALGDAYKEGKISAANVETILGFLGKSEDEIYWIMDNWGYAKDAGSSDGHSKYDDFITAVQTGKSLKQTIRKYTDNGVSEETLRSQITKHFKPKFVKMSRAERAGVIGFLLNAYAELGLTRTKARKLIDGWDD